MFHHNDRVKVKKLKKTGTIIEGPTKTKKYLVAINSMQYWINESDLEGEVTTNKKTKKTSVALFAKPKKIPKSIDLHGLTTSEAKELVLEFINDAILAGQDEIHIIHGIGSGKLKNAVSQLLASQKSISRYLLAPNNPGTTIVYL